MLRSQGFGCDGLRGVHDRRLQRVLRRSPHALVPVWLGLHGHRLWPRPLGCWGGLGYLAHGLLARRGGDQGPAHSIKKSHLGHLLRGDGDIRGHFGDSPSLEDWGRRQRQIRIPRRLELQPILLCWLLPLLLGPFRRPHKRRLGHLRRHRRQLLCACGCPGRLALCQDSDRRDLRLGSRHFWYHRRDYPVQRRGLPLVRWC